MPAAAQPKINCHSFWTRPGRTIDTPCPKLSRCLDCDDSHTAKG